MISRNWFPVVTDVYGVTQQCDLPRGSVPDVCTAEAAGQVFAGTPYRYIEKLGQGGMGEVYLVEHEELGRRLVVKLIHACLCSEPELLDRMRVEAQALARLQHPNIVEVTDFRTAVDGRPFIVMEHLRGTTLAAELRERGLVGVNEAVAYGRQLLSALAAAHAIGVVHRDVKPANIFLQVLPDGGRILKLLDFGIAKVLPGVSDRAPRPLAVPTAPNALLGTPRFVSPEAALSKPVDVRSDVYSAGLVLYVMLSGRGPFDHVGQCDRLVAAHVREEPLPPSRFSSEPVPPELDRAVLRALRKRPEERFQTAAEFERVLQDAADMLRRPTGWMETTTFDKSGFATHELSRVMQKPPQPKETAERHENRSAESPEVSRQGCSVNEPDGAESPANIRLHPERAVLMAKPRHHVAHRALGLLVLLLVTTGAAVAAGGLASAIATRAGYGEPPAEAATGHQR